jgi:cytochrome P450
MVDRALRARDRWSDGQQFDLAQEMMRLTLSIVAKTLFDAEVEGEADEIGRALTDAMDMVPLLLLPFAEHLQKLPIPRMNRLRESIGRLDRTIYRIIEERRQSGEDRGDLLSMLLLAQDVEGDGGTMTDKQLRDETMTLFLAGHETTANALSWTFYLLAQHEEVERELHRELDDVLGGRVPSPDDYPRLPYTEMVLAESMRLYPPAWALGRLAIEDVHIGQWPVAKGTVATSVSGRSRSASIRSDSRPRRRRQGRGLPTSRSAAARGSASARDSPGWKGCWCWPRSPRSGGCGWRRRRRWGRCR